VLARLIKGFSALFMLVGILIAIYGVFEITEFSKLWGTISLVGTATGSALLLFP
jgi:hypothetical protein